MPEEEETGFTFVDKRGGSASEQAAPAPPAPAPTAPAHSDDVQQTDTYAPDAPGAPGTGALPSLSVRDRLLMCIDILNQGAWIALGLVSDPATGKIERDLPQAKVAIDSLVFLADRIEAGLDADTLRELKNLLRDLQLNFVQQQNMP